MAEQKKFAEKDFVEQYSDWTSAVYNEVDWSKVQELQVREILGHRTVVTQLCQTAECLSCPNFLKHVSDLYPCRLMDG